MLQDSKEQYSDFVYFNSNSKCKKILGSMNQNKSELKCFYKCFCILHSKCTNMAVLVLGQNTVGTLPANTLRYQ